MKGTLTALWNFITGIPAWLLAVVTAIFASLSDLGKDIFCWILDEVLGLVLYIINALPINPAVFDPSSYFAALPASMVNSMAYLHVPQALALIVAALIIRFGLQLIPFVRLGS